MYLHAERLMYWAKSQLATVRPVAIPLARIRGHGEVVRPGTHVAIESFPRCGSSFAVAAFRLAQEPRAVRIAHHTHMPAQVMEAARLGIPVIVLLRAPGDAVLSHVIYRPALSIEDSLRGYVRFYEPLRSVRHAFVIGMFDEVVEDFGLVIDRLNARFGTRFARFIPDRKNLERLAHEIEMDYRSRATSDEELERTIPWPSEAREQVKHELRTRYGLAPTTLRRRAESAFADLLP